ILDWADKRQTPSERAWRVAHDAAQRAIDFYPAHHGDYYDRLGRVHEWQQLDLPVGAVAAEPSRTAALQAYRQSLEHRPTQPYTWAQLAFIKMRLWQLDDEFRQAITNAHQFAPWQRRANAAVAEAGLIAWPMLRPAERERVAEAAGRATTGRRNRDLIKLS